MTTAIASWPRESSDPEQEPNSKRYPFPLFFGFFLRGSCSPVA